MRTRRFWCSELVHREDAALLVFVAAAEAAVAAAVHAEVRHVERREHHDAVVVDLVLDAVRRGAHLLEEGGILHAHERGDLLHGEGLAGLLALGEDLADAHGVDGRGVRRREGAVDQVVVDEMLAAGQVLVDLLLDDEMLRVVLGIRKMPYVLRCCHLLSFFEKRVLYHNRPRGEMRKGPRMRTDLSLNHLSPGVTWPRPARS